MVLVSVQSVEDDNGYSFKNDFAESLIIDPNSKISLINIQFNRKVDYVVLTGGNAFEIKVGSPASPKDIISIPLGTYTAYSLATAIQTSLNNVYHQTGYTFEVKVDSDGKFEVANDFRPIKLPVSYNKEWDTTDATKVESATTIKNLGDGVLSFGVNAKAKGEGPWAGVTNGTANYVIGSAKLETNYVPLFSDGGSYAEFSLNWTSATYPPALSAGDSTRGIVFGLCEDFTTTNPVTGDKRVADNANLTWLDAGIVLYKDEQQNPHVKIIEGGQDIGIDLKFAPRKGDVYRITLAGDKEYPTYQYKRLNGAGFASFNLQDGSQRFKKAVWENLELHPCIATDAPDGTNAGPVVQGYTTNEGGANILPEKVGATSHNNTHSYTEDDPNTHSGQIKRITAGVGAYLGEDGVMLNHMPADGYTDFEFEMVKNAGDFYVSIMDEEQRIKNSLANANNDGVQNVDGGASYGQTADVNFSDLGTDKTPACFVYRFNGWDTTAVGYDTASRYPPNKIYKRYSINAFNTQGAGLLVPYWEDADPSSLFDWTSADNPNPVFLIRVDGSANKVQLFVRPTKDDELILLSEDNINPTRYDGFRSLNAVTNTSAFTANQTGAWFQIDGARKGLFQGDTNGAGALTTMTELGVAGHDYIEGVQYDITEVNQTTGARIGTGTATASVNNTNYQHNTGYGVAFDSTKTHNGFRFYAGFGSAQVSQDDTKYGQVNNVMLRTSKVVLLQEYFELYPRYEKPFGDMLGFQRTKYVVQNGAYAISEGPAIPNQQTELNPTLVVNVDNLPHKSYIGKAMKADALITDKPVGSLQGLTKMVGKVPRHHDDNGDNSKSNAGPFYFDYFPYSIPLRNATELTINELDISIRNPDGTLAKDVIETHMLLDISNVEGAGEAVNQGSIGRPIQAPMNYDRLNVPKSMLTPSIRGGFAQADGPMNEQPSRHQMADKHNELEPMSHL